ncbi:MAG TPA: PEGA domain-containing protein [Kofleriaceae bacterium]|nr:PEGA domain-containing protein [Kofleriaceae bacterium]
MAAVALVYLGAGPGAGHADTPQLQPGNAGEPHAISSKLAVLELEALGMDREPVARLEILFRMELERLAGRPLPTRRQIQRIIQSSRKLRQCAGADDCLAEIGKKLEVDLVVTGTVAALGDSYVINIKAVDVATGKQLPKRIETRPLRGSPDELIEGVRVAAYQLLAPAELHGSLMVLSDLVGAEVSLDGKPVGVTPLPAPVRRLSLGTHVIKVTAADYAPFEQEVRVRFQKTTRVIVRLATEDAAAGPIGPRPVIEKKRPAPKRWYNATWFYVGAGVAAAIVGGVLGYQLANDSVIDCGANPAACGR